VAAEAVEGLYVDKSTDGRRASIPVLFSTTFFEAAGDCIEPIISRPALCTGALEPWGHTETMMCNQLQALVCAVARRQIALSG